MRSWMLLLLSLAASMALPVRLEAQSSGASLDCTSSDRTVAGAVAHIGAPSWSSASPEVTATDRQAHRVLDAGANVAV
jgi:hypothetical protein